MSKESGWTKCLVIVAVVGLLKTDVISSHQCKTSSGVIVTKVLQRDKEEFQIDAKCPCRNQSVEKVLRLCNFNDLMQQISEARDVFAKHSDEFEEKISHVERNLCSQQFHRQIISHSFTNKVEALNKSYKILTELALKISVAANHSNSRIENLSSSAIEDILCNMKTLLFDVAVPHTTSVYTVERSMSPSDVVVFTCETLKETANALKRLKAAIFRTLISELGSFH